MLCKLLELVADHPIEVACFRVTVVDVVLVVPIEALAVVLSERDRALDNADHGSTSASDEVVQCQLTEVGIDWIWSDEEILKFTEFLQELFILVLSEPSVAVVCVEIMGKKDDDELRMRCCKRVDLLDNLCDRLPVRTLAFEGIAHLRVVTRLVSAGSDHGAHIEVPRTSGELVSNVL